MGSRHERLDPARRKLVYSVFEAYHAQRRANTWDRADRLLNLARHVVTLAQQQYPAASAGAALYEYLACLHVAQPLFDRVYVDEVTLLVALI